MKRILAILCVIAVLCGLCVPAMAAGTITVSVKSSWSQVNLYCWENGEMATWPGTPMTKNGDWWTLEIPAGTYTNVIANDGTNQTADLKMDGSADCWIDADAGVVYTDKACTNVFGGGNNGGNAGGGVDLSGLNSLALVGGGIPGLPEWAPGEAACNMTKVSNGVYTKVIAVTAGAAMEIKAAGNGSWNDAYNFGPAVGGTEIVLGTKMEMINGGGAQNFKLNVSKDCNLKFTVDLTGDVPTMLVEETTEEAGTTPPPSDPGTSEPTGETYTVYAVVPDDWKNPGIWCWNDSASNPSNLGAWPGTYTMTKGADGWWTIEIPVGYNNLLINANGGSSQTPDITGLSGETVWINALTDSQNPVFSYTEIIDIEKPAETEAPTASVHATSGLNANNANQDQAKGGKDLTVLLAVVGSVVIIAVAAVIIIIAKGKKKA